MAGEDRAALEILFRSTDGEHWEKKANWDTDATLSTWEGVTVDAIGSVVELDLFAHKLRGPIPNELGALTHLTKLHLESNPLVTGHIPETLSSLTNLKKLSLADNQLTGSVPEALRSLTNLEQLRLYNNQLTGPIPEALGSLASLEVLSLSSNQLTEPIPEALGSLTNLTVLRLDSMELTGRIPEALGSLINLEVLRLSVNQLEGHIPEALGSLTNLTELHLDNNQLTGPIPEALGRLTKLRRCFLYNNQLAGPIPRALGSLTALKRLGLNGNRLSGTVPLGVWKLPDLEDLDLRDNLLTHVTDPEDKTASTGVVLRCMERLVQFTDANSWGTLSIVGNPWEFPPAAVVFNGLESIRKYYDTWEQCDFSLVEVHALKVVFVGAYGAGKTSLARSIKMGRGDRTPEIDENSRTTVGVDLHSHILSNGTECKIFDVAGQIVYYGLHQFFLTERAVYVVVLDVTKFEGLSGEALDEAIEENILEWVSLLHMRTPLCTVMLVGSHYDLLDGAPEENGQLLATVEQRFLELHAKWKSLRHRQNSNIDARMTILPGVFPVGCKLSSESASFTAGDGLQAIGEALSKQTVVVSRIPPSWVAARYILQATSTHDDSSGGTTVADACRRPWELRSVMHAKFKSFVDEGRTSVSQGQGRQHPGSCFPRLREDGIRHSMDGAIELRAFSGTVISHDVFVVLDVAWLAGVLKPMLDHRGITRNEMGDQVFADRVLGTSELILWASELVGGGILRKGFARLLWSLHQQVIEGVVNPAEMEPVMFEEILEGIGVTIPLPIDENADTNDPLAEDTKSSAGSVHDGSRRDGVDLLVIMRLPLKADAETRRNLGFARQAAFPDSGSGNSGLKAVFEFDHAGAPHGLPERVIALSHKIGVFSSRARWRLGGLVLLKNHGVSGASSMMILEYDKKTKIFGVEALGQGPVHIQAMQFVISALYHVARDFPGASWTGWMGCGMGHDGEKMYHLATSNEGQNHKPGSGIVPLTRNSQGDEWTKQSNMCSMQGLVRGSCTLDPDVFGKVLDVRQPYPPEEVPDQYSSDARRREEVLDEQRSDPPRRDEMLSRYRSGVASFFKLHSVGIAGSGSLSAGTLFATATTIDDSKVVQMSVCYGFAALILVVAFFAAFVAVKDHTRRQETVNGAGQIEDSLV